jgi:hypothetical protein
MISSGLIAASFEAAGGKEWDWYRAATKLREEMWVWEVSRSRWNDFCDVTVYMAILAHWRICKVKSHRCEYVLSFYPLDGICFSPALSVL